MAIERRSRQNPAIREFILRNVAGYPGSIVARTAKEFSISRTAVNNYMRNFINNGLITAQGKTLARRYRLKSLVDITDIVKITPGIFENDVWREKILPHIKGVNSSIVDICQYGFTEMFNNVIDHSQSPDAMITYTQTYADIRIFVVDNGVGIFEKIQKYFNLTDPRSALLELAKGKLTSDKARHTGEGIFFTSRMFDMFIIDSGHLSYQRTRRDDDDWLIETHDIIKYVKGTVVSMTISTNASWTAKNVFDKYSDFIEDDGVSAFTKTHVPILLGRYPGEQLVSRSQAKRILSRFDRFSEVMLDFRGVQQIGQPFADEIFRVFANEHPQVKVVAINTSSDVQRMIEYARANNRPANTAGISDSRD